LTSIRTTTAGDLTVPEGLLQEVKAELVITLDARGVLLGEWKRALAEPDIGPVSRWEFLLLVRALTQGEVLTSGALWSGHALPYPRDGTIMLPLLTVHSAERNIVYVDPSVSLTLRSPSRGELDDLKISRFFEGDASLFLKALAEEEERSISAMDVYSMTVVEQFASLPSEARTRVYLLLEGLRDGVRAEGETYRALRKLDVPANTAFCITDRFCRRIN
jgi:hypothetical protein